MAKLVGRIFLNRDGSWRPSDWEGDPNEYHFATEKDGRAARTVCGDDITEFNAIIGQAESELVEASRNHEWLAGMTACAVCFAGES